MGKGASEMTHDDTGDGQTRESYEAKLTSSGINGNTEGNDEAKTEEIKAGIEQTRNEMSHTIDAIQGKLNPQNIVEQAKGSVREATIGRVEDMVNNATYTAKGASSSLMDTIKQNPLQAAVAGLSLGWLIMKSRSSSGNQSNYRYDNIRGNYTQGYGQGLDYNYNYEAQNKGRYNYESQNRGDGIGQTVGRAGEKVGDVAGQVGQKAGDVVGQVGEKAGDVVGGVQDKAGDIAWQAQHQAQRAQGQFERMLRENPLAVGAAAVVLGAAIGLAVPETEQEHKLMGEARDNVMDRAKEVAGDAMDKVKSVTGEVQQTVKEEAQRQGITQS
jgi:ElaB/YqjD/DUF883 family membrane-anchored ribosome-binding protein